MTRSEPGAPWHAWLARSKGWHMIDEVDLVATIAAQCDWLRLCEQLEALADRLPCSPTQDETAAIRVELRRLASAPHDDFIIAAESLFGPQMGMPLTHSLIGHVAGRHAARVIQAHDLIEALDPRAPECRRQDAETLGYMLRCFFEGSRQIVALERLALLELGAERLTASARALLTERIIESCDAD